MSLPGARTGVWKSFTRKVIVKLLTAIFFAICICSTASTPAYSADADVIARLDRIERLLQSQGLLDMLQQIEALQRELSSIHGEIEFQNHTLELLKKRQRDLYTDIDQRLQRLERSGIDSSVASSEITFVDTPGDGVPPLQTIEPIANNIAESSVSQQAEDTLMVEVVENKNRSPALKPITERHTPVATTPVANLMDETLTTIETTVELDPVQIRAQYQQAFKLLKQSRYEQAIKAFREFLFVNPRSEYSDNAQYWLGEAYYVTRQFEQALLEYNKLLTNYPDSKKLTHSLLKIGFCYYEMGEMEEALNRLENLKQQHPGTTAARLADERLKKIVRVEQQTTTEIN